MAVYFLDSSAISKRYFREPGSVWINGRTEPSRGHRLIIAAISSVEVVSAMVRRVRSGGISASEGNTLLTDFRVDLARQYRRIEITPALLDAAMRLAEAHALRGYDAVQLASALEADAASARQGLSCTLISADLELNAAAAAEGLVVEDPNAHP